MSLVTQGWLTTSTVGSEPSPGRPLVSARAKCQWGGLWLKLSGRGGGQPPQMDRRYLSDFSAQAVRADVVALKIFASVISGEMQFPL